MRLIRTTLCASAAIAAIALVFAASPAAADQCILDDLIVDGSECVGLDCVCNMAFGFDTLVLKENNLRIFFDDTSSSASFPTANWRIVANDSSNGGAEYLAFEDTDNGNFPFRVFHDGGANALVVKSKRVGINTASPVVELHVVDGDTPTLRLEQNSSSGFTPQTWDVAGNETNFFVRDVTMGSKLPFRIRPGAATSSIDVSSTGNVGINNSSPTERLDVVQTSTNVAAFNANHSNGSDFSVSGVFSNTAASGNIAAGILRVTTDQTPASNANVSLMVLGAGPTEVFKVLSDGRVFVNAVQQHPDYVFEPDYPLMDLGELEAFIQENKHLPKVPNAEQASTGFDLTGLHLTLLEKVEELTLYTIAQQKEIERLKAVVEADSALRTALVVEQ